MVLWEITLGTAYFLGLKRTYRLALKIQQRLISPKHPRIRQFAHRRTRAAFDIALRFHQNIQQRDIEIGRNLGNWILRWLDRWKPSAQIRPPSSEKPSVGASSSMNMTKQVTTTQLKISGSMPTSRSDDSGRHFFTSYKNMWPKPLMIRPPMPSGSPMPTGSMIQYRHLSINESETFRSKYARGDYGGVIRKDITQWMLQN